MKSISSMSLSKYNNNLLIWIDVMRALAAQAVVLGHLHQILFINPTTNDGNTVNLLIQYVISTLSSISHEAVVVFFIISGYLVGGRVIKDSINQSFYFKSFIQNRMTRLLIVLIPALLLTALLDFVAFNYADGMGVLDSRQHFYPQWWRDVNTFGLQSFFINLSFLQMIFGFQFGTNLSLWSLSNEFWYYLLLPLLMGIIFSENNKKIWFVMLSGCILALFILSSREHDPYRPVYYFYNFIIWLLGAFSFFINTYRRLVFSSLALLLLGVLIKISLNIDTIPPDLLALMKIDLLIGITTIVIMSLLRFIPIRILKRSAFFFSGYSFSLYIIHLPLFFLMISCSQYLGNGLVYNSIGLGYFVFLWLMSNLLAWTFSLFTERKTKQLRNYLL
jgi:peptidoglycan/LPS O-acetylase OafA/YrhL